MIEVKTGQGSYCVRFGNLLDLEPGPAILDENVDRLWPNPFTDRFLVSSGESSKSIGWLESTVEWLSERHTGRRDSVYVVGGGVTGDLGGFAAATYMRGIRYVQVPTTLLAMVDSSVGGKVAVNLKAGKNLLGAFYPPSEVVIPLEVLETLPERHWNNGMAEVWKTAFIMDSDLVGQLESGMDRRVMIERCIVNKARIVQDDEFELSGRRAILNFGHTIGHALEAITGYGPVLHGEAVAIGMVAEARLGENIGLTPTGTTQTIESFLIRQGLPTSHEALKDVDIMLATMGKDKKAVNGQLGFSLLTEMGKCKLVHSVSIDDVMLTLNEL